MREEDKNAFVSAWADAVQKGAPTSTPETQEHLRSLLGFPEATDAEKKAMLEDKEDPEEDGALQPKGKGSGKGNGADKSKVYVLTTMNAQEARKAWKEHVDELDGLGGGGKTALSQGVA